MFDRNEVNNWRRNRQLQWLSMHFTDAGEPTASATNNLRLDYVSVVLSNKTFDGSKFKNQLRLLFAEYVRKQYEYEICLSLSMA